MNLTVREAAQFLNVTEEEVLELAAKGKIPSRTVHQQLCFNKVELLEWAQRHRRRVETGMFRISTEKPTLRVSEALAKGGIHRNVAAADTGAALSAIAALLPLPPGVDRDVVTTLFAMAPGTLTAHDGIAIPHARSPVVLPVDAAIVSLFFFEPPVDMRADDGKRIRSAFAVLSPTIRAHLHILSRLAGKLSDDAFHKLLDERASDEAIFRRLRELESGDTPEVERERRPS
jgi:PTS system nitrogen regulatory IIA component